MIQSSSSSATAYSLKWAKPQLNDFSSSDWLAGSWATASAGSWGYQGPSSCASILASVLSTTPSPFRSPPAPSYQIFSSAGVPNCSPVGRSDTPIFVVSTLTVMKTESPIASSPTPGTNCGSVMVSVRNGWTALSMLLV